MHEDIFHNRVSLTCEFDTVVYISKYWIGCFWSKHSGSSLLPYCYPADYLELSTLAPVQRILLTTDGTLTKILEAYLSEEIQMVKLSERSLISTQDIPWLELEWGSEVIERKILLQGKESRRNFLYAESILIPERLDKHFRGQLLESEIPLGKLMLAHRMETFKEIITSGKESPNGLSAFFQINNEDKLLSRTYRRSHHSKPVMLITEKFPESYFLAI
jgi:chorismate-pyruvate lyase